MSPVRDWIRQSRSMCLPWTCGPVIDLSCTRRIPAPVTCLDRQAAKSTCAAASEMPGRLAQIRREESGDVPPADSWLPGHSPVQEASLLLGDLWVAKMA